MTGGICDQQYAFSRHLAIFYTHCEIEKGGGSPFIALFHNGGQIQYSSV